MIIEKYEADWCGPCKALTKTMSIMNLSDEHEIVVLDIDSDFGNEQAITNGVRGVPTLIFRNEHGEEVGRTVGAISRKDLLEEISKHANNQR